MTADMLGFLERLEEVIHERKSEADPSKSYVASLLQGRGERATAKVIEEAGEVALAALEESRERFISESADLFFHAMVLLAAREVKLLDVLEELGRRFETSGLVEKREREKHESG